MFVTADDGVRLATRSDGPLGAEPILFLHSLGCDLSMWESQAQALAGPFRVLRFDMRGHGASDVPAGEYAMDRLGRDALAVLDAVKVKRTNVCGISIGGLAAQWLAIHAPDRVNKLVLANTAARIGTYETWQARRDAVSEQGLEAIMDQLLARFFSEGFRAASPGVVNNFQSILRRIDPQGYRACCAALQRCDMRGELSQVTAPTLVIGGTLDVSTPPAEAQALARLITEARLVMLEAAHLSNVEQPETFTFEVFRHLRSNQWMKKSV
jgi:3-oxoadipate enol-lactonase